ncbi:flagellar hook-basal body protein [Rickettsiales endosymbiont of Trichoplax sp. H2]|uniref:flagellar hook-basal body protein n=1 Tax=Rickettsiales endosymbiont of Trichoplax sp. H2 TaxID=2021221 RepID=UPI0012B21231|nr:flagellar hook-basal body complex protein [Rickettsiales endosymbiont of Trichoplax sp. H2]MSO13893.1 Flagellar basal-body rod protein FlgG [Rickettsiales endosymbiont of Trichoplax sp. H2]
MSNFRALNIAATGMSAQQKRVDTAANNLANSNTPGFKKSIAEFNELPYQTERAAGTGNQTEGEYYSQGIQYGTGVGIGATSINFAPGEGIERSKDSLSLQIIDNTGNNFFVVNLPNGEQAYTRNGQFKLDNEGRIITANGYIVDPEVNVSPDVKDTIKITEKGEIQVKLLGDENTAAPNVLGRINLAKFINPQGLEQIGNSLFKATNSSGDPIEGNPFEGDFAGVQIKQGSLEASNTNTLTTMTDLIKSQQVYSMNSKVIQTSEKMLDDVVRIKS